MIELHNLGMSYDLEQTQLQVLEAVDLSVANGETLAIVGPSGSGKTTLLVLLAGLEQPHSGSISLDGITLNSLDADALADIRRDRLGIIFQSFHLVQSLTALGNVALPLEIAGQKNAPQRARDMLDKVGLTQRQNHYPAQLSGGEQQRVAIARAIAKRPDVLLCDEPTGALDAATGVTVLEAIERINRELGTTTAVITHNAAIGQMADRVVSMRDGRIASDVRIESKTPVTELSW